METLKKVRNLLVSIGMSALVVTSIAGCTADETAAPSAGPSGSTEASASASPTDSAAPEPVSAVDPDEPYDPEDMQDWAEDVTAGQAEGTSLYGITSHMEPASSGTMSNSFSQIEPGSYSFWFVCRGDGDVALTFLNAGAEIAKLEGTCSDSIQGGDIMTTATGLNLDIVVTTAPVDVVVRITDPLPR